LANVRVTLPGFKQIDVIVSIDSDRSTGVPAPFPRREERLEGAFDWRVCLCVVALTTGSRSFAAPPDQVQESAPPGESGSLIVITGSRIPRSELTAVSPVTLVDGYEFKLQGATNAEDVLNWLPQVNPSQGEFAPPGATGAATVDLRGLGAVRTLVLVNGHRLMPGDPRYPVPDINAVPTSLIQRVEVLTGGAAAVYGSDAVAGVVNFILDTKFNGLKVEGQIGAYQHENRDKFARELLDRRQLPYPEGSVFDGRRESLSVSFGHGFFGNRAHVTLYGGYRHLDAVTQDQRDYGSCPITARIIDQRPSSVLECGGPNVSYPGNFFDNLDNVYQATPDRLFVPGLSRFNYAPWHFIQRPDTRYTAGGFANFDFSNALQAYAEVMAMRDRTSWQVGPSGDFRNTETINCDNPLLSEQQRSLICRTGNFVGEIPTLDDNGNLLEVAGTPTPFFDPVTGAAYSRAWLLIALRNIEGGSIEDVLEHESIRLLGGFKGDLGRGVTYDASYLAGRVSLDRQYRNTLSIQRLGRALDVVTDPSTGQPICRSALIASELGASAPDADANCVPWDVFAPGQVTAEATAYLTIPPSMRGSFKERVGNVNATVELDRWGIGSPWTDEGSAINLGAEYRKDSVEFDPDEFSRVGDIAGFGEQVFPIQGSINTKEIFGEARIPLLAGKRERRLAFEGGFRQSWYESSQSKFSTSAYKLAIDLTAVPGLRIRASQQRAIRAPNVLELLAPPQPDSFLRDPCAGASPAASQVQCALTGVTTAQYGHVANFNGLFEYNAIIGGNEDLRPETATTRTIGIVVQPRFLRGFSATIDWWDIHLKDAISKIGAQAIVDGCIASGDPVFCSRIHRDPNGSLGLGDGFVDNRQANLGSLKVRGIDGNADYDLPLGRAGSANFGFRGGYVLRWIVDNGGLSTPYDCAGLFGAPCQMQPRWKHTARATWDAPHGITLSLQWRHVGGVKLAALDPRFNLADQVSPGHAKLRPQDYLDVATVLHVRKGFDLRLGINNVLDRQPPLVVSNTAAGDGPYNSNTYPTWYDPLGRYIFAAIAVDLKP
jgi:outer membrane receptor protein involved in Fe transport